MHAIDTCKADFASFEARIIAAGGLAVVVSKPF